MDKSALRRAARPLLLGAFAAFGIAAAGAQEPGPEDLVVQAPGGYSYNGATGRMEMTNPTISQGELSITAAKGSALEVNEGAGEGGIDYRFEGDVRIRSAEALITANVAEFVTRNERLERFVLSGEPARFEDLSAGNAEQAFGEAEQLVYDAVESVVSLDGQVRVVVGQNEFRGCDLIYDLGAEKVSSGASECERPLEIIRIAPSEDAAGRQAP